MTLEQEVLLALMQTAIAGKKFSLPFKQVEWDALIRESIQQSVYLNLFGMSALLKPLMPEGDYDHYFKSGYGILAANTALSAAQKMLVSFLEEEQIQYVILKGEAAAYYYPHPEFRRLGDVDFLVHPNDGDRIAAFLLSKGFAVSHENDARHRVFAKAGLRFEMHFEVAGLPKGVLREKITTFLSSVFTMAEKANNGVGDYLKPAAFHHALILLLHMQHHMLDRGMGLRHLCDWACFLQRTDNEPFWNEQLLPFLTEIGLLSYAATMSKVSASYLGIRCPAWATDADTELCIAVMEDILSGGNFGMKDCQRKESATMISYHKNENKVVSLCRTMKQSVLAHHPNTKTNKLLFVWHFCRRSLCYFWSVLAGKRTSTIKAARQANKRKRVYDQLRIFEVDVK